MSFLVLIVVGGTLGGWLIRPCGATGIEGYALRLFTGLSLCAALILVLGSISLGLTQFLFFVLAAGCIAFEFWTRSQNRPPTEHPSPNPAAPFSAIEWICIASITAANVLALVSALAPNTNWDAGVAHLALPQDYTRLGRIALIEGNVYSAYPQFMHALYTFAYYQGGERAAALLSWIYGPLGCAAMYALGNRVDGRLCGLVAAALFAVAPIYFDQVGTVSLDVAFAGMTVMALTCLMAWHGGQRARWLVIAALLAGSAAGIRHTGLLVTILMILGALAVARGQRLQHGAVFAAIAILATFPWLARAYLASGNPVYPFLPSLFPTPALPDVQTTAILAHESAATSSWKDFLMFPWNIVMRPYWYDGWTKSPGVWVITLGPIGLLVGGSRARWLGAFSIAGGITFFFFQRLARYLLPFFAPMMVVAAIAFVRLEALRKPLAVLLVLTSGYGLTLGAAAVHFKVPAALGFQNRDIYLADRVERYPAFAWINESLPAETMVFTLDPRSYFIKRPTYQNLAVLDRLREISIQEQMAWFEDRGITHLMYPNNYIDESPIFESRGYRPMLESWRLDREHFEPVQIMTFPGREEPAMERVEIYRIHPGGR